MTGFNIMTGYYYDSSIHNLGVYISNGESGDILKTIELGAYPAWVNIDPLEITVPPLDSAVITVNFNAAALENGIYNATLYSKNNTFENEFIYPVILTVDMNGFDTNTDEIIMPTKYAFKAPYPNPFNQSVNISYALPEKSDVSIIIYDLLGREVVKLINGVQQAGWHKMVFVADNRASGIYFIRMQTETGFNKTRKMVLLK
jgi:hypothetical protein